MNPFMQRICGPGISGHLIAALAGGLITLSLAPFYLWPLSIFAMWLFALSLEKESLEKAPSEKVSQAKSSSFRQALIRGWWFGFGLFGSGASWVYVSIHEHGNAPVPLAILLTCMFTGGLALCLCVVTCLYVRFFQQVSGKLLLALPALWLLGEWFRCWFLTGFPWLFIGYSQVDGPLAGWAPIIGTLGIGFILAATGGCLAQLLLHKTRGEDLGSALPSVVFIVLLWLCGPLLNQIDWVEEVPDSQLTVHSIQANIAQQDKWKKSFLEPTLKLYRTMTESAWGSDIILWPETSIPRLYHRAQGFISRMDSAAKEHNTSIIAGIPFLKPDTDYYYNSIMTIGQSSGIYHKRRLVPFGEYVPLEDYLRGIIEFFDLPMSSFVSGPDQDQLLEITRLRNDNKPAKTFKLAPFICYEILYPDMVANTLPEADVLLTISNDTWFGASHGPIQHMQMAQMRALENGRYLIRGTNNGVTAIVNHKGKILVESERLIQTTLIGEVRAMRGITPYSRFGSWPMVLFCMGLLTVLLIRAKNPQ